MIGNLLPWLMSFLALALLAWATILESARLLRSRPAGLPWTLGAGLLAVAIAAVPVNGLPLARFVAGYGFTPSVPLLALLADGAIRGTRGQGWLKPAERKAAWLWGTLAGLALYPSAMGFVRFDAYGFGWGFTFLGVMVAALSAWLIWRGNRFGIVLVLATAAWQGKIFESSNHWDCLVDPAYTVASVAALATGLCCKQRVASKPGADL
jgi:hypothetical protein